MKKERVKKDRGILFIGNRPSGLAEERGSCFSCFGTYMKDCDFCKKECICRLRCEHINKTLKSITGGA